MTDLHQCHICQSGNAFWGFGPPLADVEIWSCQMHLSQTEDRLTKKPAIRRTRQPDQTGRLL